MFQKRPHDCKIHGHKFEARYDERERQNPGNPRYFDLNELREYMTIRTYVKDICIFCGIEKSK